MLRGGLLGPPPQPPSSPRTWPPAQTAGLLPGFALLLPAHGGSSPVTGTEKTATPHRPTGLSDGSLPSLSLHEIDWAASRVA